MLLRSPADASCSDRLTDFDLNGDLSSAGAEDRDDPQRMYASLRSGVRSVRHSVSGRVLQCIEDN